MTQDSRLPPEPTRRELAWLKRLRAVVGSQPPNTWVYVSPAGINLMRCGADGDRVMLGRIKEDGYDPAYVVGYVDAPSWDGGDW